MSRPEPPQGPLHPERTHRDFGALPHRHRDGVFVIADSHPDGWVEHDHDSQETPGSRTTDWEALVPVGQMDEYERLAKERSTPHPELVRPFPRAILVTIEIEGGYAPYRLGLTRDIFDDEVLLVAVMRNALLRAEGR